MMNDIKGILIDKEQISKKTEEIAAKISCDYAGKNPLIICILKGAFVFAADLVRHITIPCTIDFMVVSSYGAGTVSSGDVKILKDVGTDVAGRHIIIVEDVLDSGNTLFKTIELLKKRSPASVALCCLLDKPDRRAVKLSADYVGFQIPDEFVVGFGLDYNEKYRNLPFIGVLKSEVYSPDSRQAN